MLGICTPKQFIFQNKDYDDDKDVLKVTLRGFDFLNSHLNAKAASSHQLLLATKMYSA